jgi:hypothetical protein
MAGYDYEYWKSNNALLAEEKGYMTKSQLAKKLKVSPAIIEKHLDPVEWHHTSKFYNFTNYYDPEDVTPELLEQMKAESKKKAQEKAQEIELQNPVIEFEEWQGSRNYGRYVKYVAKPEKAIIKGSFIYFQYRGQIIKKKINGNHIEIKTSNNEIKTSDNQPNQQTPVYNL